ncbi:unnamed protein product [Orchesella dallaii]|uniref:Gustatory receptor n=1 Tax=Orchesella dallaii TaxID=48710 RepID=A0ABP1R2D7_9HEXA
MIMPFFSANRKFNFALLGFPSKTEIYSQNLYAYNTFLSDGVSLVLTFLYRNQIIRFHENLARFLVQAADENSTNPSNVYCINLLDKVFKTLTKYQIIIFFVIIVNLTVAAVVNIEIFFIHVNTQDMESLREYFIFALTMLWISFSYVGVTLTKLWFIGYLKCLNIGALLLQQNLQAVSSADEVDMVLERIRQFEFLTQEFNDAFGLIITVGFFSLSFAALNSIFQTMLYVMTSDAWVGWGHIGPLTVSVCVLFTLCEACNAFEMQYYFASSGKPMSDASKRHSIKDP